MTATSTSSTATRAEICVTACSDAWRGAGEILAHAVGTVPSISARLARLTHSPDLAISDGEAFLMSDPAPLGRSAAAGGTVEFWAPYIRIFDVLNTGKRQSMMGASQIDPYGNQNISAIGDWRRPTRQLIGARGAPGNTVNHRTDYWIAGHSARIFVPQVDIVCGVGNDRARAHENSSATAMRFHHLGQVITNLAVLDYDQDGRLKVASLHPGVSAEEVRENTGFEIDVSNATETRQPTDEELRLIREVIDPRGLRDREVKS